MVKKIIILVIAGYLTLTFSLNRLKVSSSRQEAVLASKTISLDTRYANEQVNSVFKDNILLTLGYLGGVVRKDQPVSWSKVRSPAVYTFTLDQGEIFAFHDSVYARYQGKVQKTTNAHFISSEGFRSDGYLVGDGVCHLASLINWVATDAGLQVESPVSHDFAVIPEIPRGYGVSIYTMSGDQNVGAQQNLYIKNNQDNQISLKFEFDGVRLTVSALAVPSKNLAKR